MKRIGVLLVLIIVLASCKTDSQLEKDISKIDIDFTVERFDKAFSKAKPEDLKNLKKTFPFLFSKRVPDSVWIERMNDTLQQQLASEVDKGFGNLKDVEEEINDLFQHIKYYDKAFRVPRIVTLTSDVDYRNKVIVTDTIVLIALDTYLGTDHEFYSRFPQFVSQNMKSSQIVSDLASEYSKRYIYQTQKKTFLDEMIYFGKQLYFKDKVIPFKSNEEKMGYTKEQLEFALANESYVWRHFIENEMLYSTDTGLPARFIAPAPFSKFYLELDAQSPGRLGQYIGWQIVKSYMNNNNVSLMNMLQEDAIEIFNKSKYKPQR